MKVLQDICMQKRCGDVGVGTKAEFAKVGVQVANDVDAVGDMGAGVKSKEDRKTINRERLALQL